MADLATLRSSLGEVELLLLSGWTPFQRELFLFSRDTDDSSPGTIEDTPFLLAARAAYASRFGATDGPNRRSSRIQCSCRWCTSG
jgi:hypothetical protein